MSLQQVPFGVNSDFADNPEPRCPCLLLLDTSDSMRGQAMDELNAGIQVFKDELTSDAMASKRVEVSIVTFGPVEVVSNFQTADAFVPRPLVTTGDTPMGSAIETGLTLIEQRKQSYRSNGVAFYRPWIFLVTDGEPTDPWVDAAAKVKSGESANHFSFFALGVEGARMDILSQIAAREALKLKELRFRDLFLWLSNSLRSVSRSAVGDKVQLINPVTPQGWAAV